MHILVTNDDGVNAPGLLALAQAMRQYGTITVLHPIETGLVADTSRRCIAHCTLRKRPRRWDIGVGSRRCAIRLCRTGKDLES